MTIFKVYNNCKTNIFDQVSSSENTDTNYVY